MKKIFFTPGPAQLYPTVSTYIKKGLKESVPSISHRGKQFEQIYKKTVSGLQALLNIPDSYHIFFVGSGTEAMERTIQNCVEKYSFHFVNGSFSKRFFETAVELGKKAQHYEVPLGQGFDFAAVTIPKQTELICLTQNETSTGVMLPITDIKRLQTRHPDVLFALDIVSSVPYVDMDFTFLDIVFFSVQKGFGLPAGLGVMVVSPRAIKQAESLVKKGIVIGSYHSFRSLIAWEAKKQTPETPPVLTMYLLGKVIEDMRRISIKKIRQETEQKAQLVYNFLDKHQKLTAFVTDPHFRSQTVMTVTAGNDTEKIMAYLEKKGMIVGAGYGQLKDSQFRIANFPAHTLSEVKRLLRSLDDFQ